jgi:hypothetical protein
MLVVLNAHAGTAANPANLEPNTSDWTLGVYLHIAFILISSV